MRASVRARDASSNAARLADQLVAALQVGTGQLTYLGQGKADRPQAADHLDAPQGFLVEEPVVTRAAAAGVGQPGILVLAQRLDRHPDAA